MKFTAAFILAALPFLAQAFPSEPSYGGVLYARDASTDYYHSLMARADRDKTHDPKAVNYQDQNMANPGKARKEAERVSTEAMQQGAAGQAGMQQNANIRATAHTGGSQPGNVVTTTTGQAGDPQSQTHHFGVTSDNRGQQHWDGTDAVFTNANQGKTAAVKPASSKHWDGPNQPKKFRRDLAMVAARSAIPDALALAYANAYADAYEDAVRMHRRSLYMEEAY